MKSQIFLFILFLFGITSCSSLEVDKGFNIIEQLKTPLGSEGFEEFFYWDFAEDENLWELEIGELAGIEAFRDSLHSILGQQRFENVIKKESTQSLENTQLLTEEDGDRINALLVHSGSLGHIRPINVIEAQILNYQLLKYPLLRHPTEFHGFIAYNNKLQRYRVYFGASDQPWPPRPTLLIQQLDKDIEDGWRLRYHLHNHYEEASNDYLGILAPSLADAQYFKSLSEKYGLEKALITNGFHTVEIGYEDFYEFESH